MIGRCVALATLLVLAGPVRADWAEGHTVGVPVGLWDEDGGVIGGCGAWSPTSTPRAWGFGHFPPEYNSPCPYPGQQLDFGPAAGVWDAVNVVSLGVPDDATAVYVGGVNVITRQAGTGNCGFRLYIQRLGARTAAPVSCQSVQSGVGGQRAGCGAWVALEEGRFEVMWQFDPPDGGQCAMMTVLHVQAYLR